MSASPFLHELQVMYDADVKARRKIESPVPLTLRSGGHPTWRAEPEEGRLTIDPVTCTCCGDLRRVVDDQGLSFRCPHCTDTVNWCPVCSTVPQPTEQETPLRHCIDNPSTDQ